MSQNINQPQTKTIESVMAVHIYLKQVEAEGSKSQG